jgi:hypothetical protein
MLSAITGAAQSAVCYHLPSDIRHSGCFAAPSCAKEIVAEALRDLSLCSRRVCLSVFPKDLVKNAKHNRDLDERSVVALRLRGAGRPQKKLNTKRTGMHRV